MTHGPMSMQVDGKYEDWMEVLRLMYHGGACLDQERVGWTHHDPYASLVLVISDVGVGPSPAEMSRETAFRIFPIVHQYGIQLIVGWCEKAFQKSQLDLWPSDPITSSEVLNHPGLVQCLALADAKQCDSLVQSCLSQLIRPGHVPSHDTVFDALASPHLDTLIDGLRSETKSKIIRMMAGLPEGYKVGPYNFRAGCSVSG